MSWINLRKETEFLSRLATKATKEATNGLKADLRNDVVGSGFGVRLSRTWQSKIYDDILQADTKAKIEALEQERDRQIARTQNMERLLGRIEGASDEQDAPLAPVLRDTIDRLYGRAADADQSR